MKGLILKDLYNLKAYAKQYILTLLMFAFIGCVIGSSAYSQGLVTLYLCMMPVTAFSLDESSHWDRYALTMPIGRKDLVAAKYVMVLITIGSAFILSGIMTVVIRFRMGESTDMQGWMADGLSLAIILIYGLLFCSVLLPFSFKFGAERARMIIILIVLIPVAAIFLISHLVDLDRIDLGALLAGINPLFILAAVVLVTFILFGISYMISCRIYEKKEF